MKTTYYKKIKKNSYSLYMIKNLSPSRASQFKTCPKQFKFSNIDKIKEPTNEVQAKGTLVHEALEELYKLDVKDRPDEIKQEEVFSEINIIEKTERDSGDKSKILHDIFRKIFTEKRNSEEYYELFNSDDIDIKKFGKDALKLLTNYLTLENPKKIKALEVERWVRGPIEDLNLRGILDRIDRDKDGNLIIVDYKSGKAPDPKYKDDSFFAMKLYALLIRDELGEIPKELKLIYLKNSTVRYYEVDENTLNNVREEILEIWKNIKFAYESNEFPPIKNPLCKNWCYYKPICPEFNENPPDTDKLASIENEISITKKKLEEIDIIENPENIPKKSPLHNIDKEINELKEKIEKLTSEKKLILEVIDNLLRKQSSS